MTDTATPPDFADTFKGWSNTTPPADIALMPYTPAMLIGDFEVYESLHQTPTGEQGISWVDKAAYEHYCADKERRDEKTRANRREKREKRLAEREVRREKRLADDALLQQVLHPLEYRLLKGEKLHNIPTELAAQIRKATKTNLGYEEVHNPRRETAFDGLLFVSTLDETIPRKSASLIINSGLTTREGVIAALADGSAWEWYGVGRTNYKPLCEIFNVAPVDRPKRQPASKPDFKDRATTHRAIEWLNKHGCKVIAPDGSEMLSTHNP